MPSDYQAVTRNNIERRGTAFDDIGEFMAHQLYSDKTNFIYELLQNAEDAGATRVAFRLYPERLEVRHDDGRLSEGAGLRWRIEMRRFDEDFRVLRAENLRYCLH